ncbi:MAG TPA: glycosyltransferase family 4 protein [Dehalococcoidia bacterium]
MKILQLAPLWETVPPPAYGGTESVVYELTEELVRRGHQVVLRASGDSQTTAELRSTYHRSLRTAADLADRHPHDWLHVATALAEAEEFDVVHNHAGELAMAMAQMVRVPVLTTMHCLITPDTHPIWNRYPWYYNTISWSEYEQMPPVEGPAFAGVVYNGIRVETFPFQARKDGYLLFLSRISPEKGAHLAIQVARRAGCRLVMAGKVDERDRAYYESTVRPLIDGRQVEFIGEADACLKRELYRNARALLLPLTWEEPFGLVMVEAMACGTPVITMRRGAAPEIVVHGETGFLAEDLDQMVAAVSQVDRIDPARCRRHVETRFDVAQMVDAYEAIYRWIVVTGAQGPSPAMGRDELAVA